MMEPFHSVELLAYIGPGAGFALAGSFIAALAVVGASAQAPAQAVYSHAVQEQTLLARAE